MTNSEQPRPLEEKELVKDVEEAQIRADYEQATRKGLATDAGREMTEENTQEYIKLGERLATEAVERHWQLKVDHEARLKDTARKLYSVVSPSDIERLKQARNLEGKTADAIIERINTVVPNVGVVRYRKIFDMPNDDYGAKLDVAVDFDRKMEQGLQGKPEGSALGYLTYAIATRDWSNVSATLKMQMEVNIDELLFEIKDFLAEGHSDPNLDQLMVDHKYVFNQAKNQYEQTEQ